MKVLSFTLLLLFTVSFTEGQFVFTAANSNPVAGDNYIELKADTNISRGSPGANKIWNFQSLKISHDTSAYYSFITPTSTSNCVSNAYAAATILDTISWIFYDTNDKSIVRVGEFHCGMIYFTDTLFVYPFAFGSNYQNDMGSNCMCSLPEDEGDHVSKTYDSYGTLMLPGITYYNVARVVESRESSTYYGQGRWDKGYSYTYRWYDEHIKFPLLTISFPVDSADFGHIPVWYESKYKTVTVGAFNSVGINNFLLNNNELSIYPNPANESATLKFNNPKKENCTLTLIDAQGRSVMVVNNIATDQIVIHKDRLAGGLYFCKLSTETRIIACGKLVIE